MRVLHTADWHLGKTLRGVSLHDDHAHVLDQVFRTVVDEAIEVLLIAGDVYDKASPSEAAMKLYSDFLERVHDETDAAIVVIAGNHDSGQRLGTASKLFDRRRILVRGPIEREEAPLLLEDDYGKVAISALPYGEIYAARRVFETEDIRSPEEVLRAQIKAARAQVPDGARWIVVAHAFVTNCLPTESERRLSVGTVETVSADIFEDACYVALGHLLGGLFGRLFRRLLSGRLVSRGVVVIVAATCGKDQRGGSAGCEQLLALDHGLPLLGHESG